MPIIWTLNCFLGCIYILYSILYSIWLNCYCWGNSSILEGRFSKWVFEYLSIYLWKLQLLQEGWATSLGTYWSKKWRSCCSVRAGHDLTYYPTNSINRNRLHWGHKGQDIANDYIIKLVVSAFRFHLKYALVLRYLVTSDGVKGTTYSRAQKQSLWELWVPAACFFGECKASHT